MSQNPYKTLDTVTLRRRAEEKARLDPASGARSLSTETVRQLPFELRVHQIQLEMQNAELLRVQAELDAARMRYFDLYDRAPVGYLTLGEKGLILEANLTAANLLGVQREALAKQPFVRFVLPADVDTYFQYRQQLVGTRAPQVCELRMLRSRTAPFWGRIEATMAQDADGAPVCRAVLSDISERREAEEALLRSERNFREIFNATTEAIFIDDAVTGRLIDVNASMLRLYGYDTKEEVLAGDIGNLNANEPPYTEAEAQRRVRLAIAEGPQVFEWLARRKNGERFWAEVSLRSSEIGGQGRVLSVVRDITERKRAEDALARERQLLRTVIDNLPDAVYTKDADGRKTLANRADVNNIGAASEAEILGKKDSDLFPPEVAEPLLADDLAVIRSGKPLLNKEELLMDRQGKQRWLQTSKIPLKNADGDVVSLVGIGHDITDLKRAEAQREELEGQLRQAQKLEAVGRLAGGVAHDFNNMLQTIIGTTEILLAKADPNDPATADLNDIMAAARRSADLTRQLLAFARKQTIIPKVLDLNETVTGMLKMLNRLIGEDIDLVWQPAADLWPVKVDPSQLDQVLANLTVNARDAISGVGKVTIVTRNTELGSDYCQSHPDTAPGPYVMLAVSDTGCGMDAEALAHLFEPFFTTKALGHGTGLGLATVYGIVRQNNGAIDLESAPGKGTTFRIYLPRYAAPVQERVEAHKPAAAPGGRETVLLVEDEASLLRLARRLLQSLGYSVLATGSPREAVRIAAEHPGEIHLLLTDVVMPEMSGGELRKQVDAVRPGLRCLFMSGYTAEAIAHRGVLDEGVHFIQKPFAQATLALKLREVLDCPAPG